MANKYDIFISYRRDDGKQYARLIEKELKSRGFSAFLDYEEIRDGIFEEVIEGAITSAKIFLIVLTPKYLERCSNVQDWVRREIILAADQGKHFIPIVPDGLVKYFPENETKDLPEKIKKHVLLEQWSEVNFGQTMQSTFNQMVCDRILKYVKPRSVFRNRIILAIILLVLIISCVVGFYQYNQFQKEKKRAEMMIEYFNDLQFNWDENISLEQLQAVHGIINHMEFVEGGMLLMGANGSQESEPDFETPQVSQSVSTFYMGRYEVNTSQWHCIMGGDYAPEDSMMPITNVAFDECQTFIERLVNLTGLDFAIPTEAEWEFAARGGNTPDGTLYSGSDSVEQVAWYSGNSKGKLHICDAEHSVMVCNNLNLYDMSGNVCEWCEWTDSIHRLYSDMLSGNVSNDIIYNHNIKPHRGGAYDSEPYQVTVYHRDTADRLQGSPNIGLRLIIRKM